MDRISQFLKRAVGAEIEGRDRRAAERRMSAARLPVVKTLEAFDFSDPSQPLRTAAVGTRRSLFCPERDEYHLVFDRPAQEKRISQSPLRSKLWQLGIQRCLLHWLTWLKLWIRHPIRVWFVSDSVVIPPQVF
jgi:hypothetical protein